MECKSGPKIQFSILFVFDSEFYHSMNISLVNDGDYLNAVSEQSLAENVTRVLYPNDNVNMFIFFSIII